MKLTPGPVKVILLLVGVDAIPKTAANNPIKNVPGRNHAVVVSKEKNKRKNESSSDCHSHDHYILDSRFAYAILQGYNKYDKSCKRSHIMLIHSL